MRKMLLFFVMMTINISTSFNGSHDLVPSAEPVRLHIDDDSSSSEEEGDLCEVAITHFYPDQYKNKAYYVRPFMQRILHEQGINSRSVVHDLRRIRTGESDDSSPFNDASDIRVQKILLQAAHEALEEKEQRLNAQSQELSKERERIEKKVSKSWSAAITATSSIITSLISGLTVYYSSK